MKTNKNIDRLFQEKLKDFEVTPPDVVWKNIEHRLKNKNSKPLFPLWMRISGVAVVGLIVVISSINYFTNTSNAIDTNIITNTDTKELPKVNEQKIKGKLLEKSDQNKIIVTEIDNNTQNNQLKTIPSTNYREKSNENNVENPKSIQQQDVATSVVEEDKNSNISHSVANSNSKKPIVGKNEDTQTDSYKKVALQKKNQKDIKSNTATNTVSQKETSIANNLTSEKNTISLLDSNKNIASNENVFSKKSKETVTIDEDSKTVIVDSHPTKNQDNLLKENLTEDIKQKEDIRKWSVASQVAPVYYNSFNSKGSPVDSQFDNSPRQANISMSYGLKIGYKLNNKLSIQSGVSLMNVGYKIGDVYINPTLQSAAKLTNVNYTNTATLLNIVTNNIVNINQFETTLSKSTRGVLDQELGYIEVPLELKYNLIANNNRRKLGVNLIGGFSTLFLNKNEVFVETAEFSSNLGEANNLNNVNFSGNLGFDVDYKINKNFYFNVAPMLKIHTSTFSKNDGSFKPYVLGVYSGLNYKF